MVACSQNIIPSHMEGPGVDFDLQEVWVQGFILDFLVRVPHVFFNCDWEWIARGLQRGCLILGIENRQAEDVI